MLQEIIQRTLRVPVEYSANGDGESATRQLDVALMSIGFKLSKELFERLSSLHPSAVIETGKTVLGAVRELVGDHVQHNAYFLTFPEGVPDTTDFWLTEIFRLLLTGTTQYGRYQHSYMDMVARHDAFIASAKDRVTVLSLGKTLKEETLSLYHSLAESPIPLSGADRHLLEELAQICLADPQPESIPVRETRAIINGVRLTSEQSIQVDTITDILRLACALSQGDVTLQETTTFRSFGRPVRRALLSALDDLVARSPAQLADVHPYREQWKRLGERLHPHEYPREEHALDVFAVSRGEKKVYSLEARVEVALRDGEVAAAISLLSQKPGVLVRNLDRLIRVASEQDCLALQKALATVIGSVSGRVLLSLREHLQNREQQGTARIFTNSKGRAWVTPDTLSSLDKAVAQPFVALLDQELLRRIPQTQHLVVDPAVLNVAIPLSDKNRADGFAILPRGSTMPIEEGILRFFVYWKQRERRTDYDLSALVLDESFQLETQISWTNLQAFGAVHSGDLTDATHGATEFIDLDLDKVAGNYLIPQVNIYAGEDFTEVESCFFGFMTRQAEQKGNPFEAAAVRMKSDVRGTGKVALPLVFIRDPKGQWQAKWMHVYLKGAPHWNRVEINRLSTSVLARSIIDRRYLSMSYLIDLMKQRAEVFSWSDEEGSMAEAETFIGLQTPDGISERARIHALKNLHELIPV